MDINLEVSTNIYNMATYEVILALILGIFVCLFGYRLKKLVIFLAFFLIGYSIMQRIMPVLNANLPAIAESSLWQTILPICGGLLLSLLGFSIEKLCVALLVCFATIAIGINQFGLTWEVVIISAVIGTILGAIAVRMIKPATIIATAIAGALVVVDAIFALSSNLSHDYYTLILIGVAAVGAIFQFTNTKHIE